MRNLTGLPALSVPSGFAKNGNPIGFQMIAKHMQDAFLIGCAHAFEQARPETIQIPAIAKGGRMSYGDWEAVVGLEVHAQLNTQSKLFSSAPNSFWR